MNKIMDIIDRELYNTEDRNAIQRITKVRLLFLAAGWIKTTPQFLLKEISIGTWQMRKDAGIISPFEYELIVAMEQGGKCDVCKTPWKKEEIKINKEVITWYYRPNCTCYQRCIFCNRFMIIETKEKMTGCRYCGKIKCYGIVPGKKKNPDGETVRGGRLRNCNGILELQTMDHAGYTIYKCDKCDFVMKRKIIV